MPAAPSPTNWIAALGNEQSEAARTRRPRRRRRPAAAPPPRAKQSVGSIALAPVAAPRPEEKTAQDARGLEACQVFARRAGRRLLGQGFETRLGVYAQHVRGRRDGALAHAEAVASKTNKWFPVARRQEVADGLSKKSRELGGRPRQRHRREDVMARDGVSTRTRLDSPGAAEAKRRAAAERAMRLRKGIKKKGMTDFEMSMIQESRKAGGGSLSRRRRLRRTRSGYYLFFVDSRGFARLVGHDSRSRRDRSERARHRVKLLVNHLKLASHLGELPHHAGRRARTDTKTSQGARRPRTRPRPRSGAPPPRETPVGARRAAAAAAPRARREGGGRVHRRRPVARSPRAATPTTTPRAATPTVTTREFLATSSAAGSWSSGID